MPSAVRQPATDPGFFDTPLAATDPAVFDAIRREVGRQRDTIELIASENIVSAAVLEAQGSALTNKYARRLSRPRYYGGCEFVDVAEQIAIDRACKLFDCGLRQRPAAFGRAGPTRRCSWRCSSPGDTVLGMSLAAGGHLTHGASVNLSGKWFNALQYGVRRDDSLIDFERGRAPGRGPQAAFDRRRRLGLSAGHRLRALPRHRRLGRRAPDGRHGAFRRPGRRWARNRRRCRTRMSVTTTTHKTLRGPRGGMILSTDAELGKKINSAVFPGLQGGR